eukprot:748494-Amphidinium_carterae.1
MGLCSACQCPSGAQRVSVNCNRANCDCNLVSVEQLLSRQVRGSGGTRYKWGGYCAHQRKHCDKDTCESMHQLSGP